MRAADIEYKLPGESVFRVTTQPIHKLVLVVPVEEQATMNDQTEEGSMKDEQPEQQVEVRAGWQQGSKTRHTRRKVESRN